MNKWMKISCFLLSSPAYLLSSDIETISKTEGVLSAKVLSNFKQLFDLDSFIETGTYMGDTTAEAAKIFGEVRSIEIWEPLYKAAKNRFAYSKNVKLYFGDTTTQLNHLIEGSLGKRLYWLDAHSSGGGTGGVPGFSPILHELDQILHTNGDTDSVILIDDMRGMCHTDERTNLPLRSIIHKIKEISEDLQFYSIGDIGIIFNERTYPSLEISEIVKNSSFSRFFDYECNDEEMLEKLIDAEFFIAACNENTIEGKKFCQLKSWVNKTCLGGEVIYLLWESLRELERGDLASAIDDLQLISNSFYSHWRIDAYLIKALILNGQKYKAASIFTNKLSSVYEEHPNIIEKIVSQDFVLWMKENLLIDVLKAEAISSR